MDDDDHVDLRVIRVNLTLETFQVKDQKNNS